MAANSKAALSDHKKIPEEAPEKPPKTLCYAATVRGVKANTTAHQPSFVHLSRSRKILAENHPSVCEDAQSQTKRAHPKSSTYGWGFISM